MDFYWYYSRKDIIDPAGKSNFFKAIGVASQVSQHAKTSVIKTLWIMTLSIMTHSMMTVSTMAHKITALRI